MTEADDNASAEPEEAAKQKKAFVRGDHRTPEGRSAMARKLIDQLGLGGSDHDAAGDDVNSGEGGGEDT